MPVSTKELWATAGEAAKQELAKGQPTPGEPHPADEEYLPPVSSVRLPSRGRVYDPASPLYLCESLDIKAVTAKEENILASSVLIKKGTVLSTLMRACITNRSVDPDQMLVGDRNAVLIAIRVSAYGPAYAVKVTCPECGESAEHDFDLGRLPLKTLDIEPVGGPGSNEFEFRLPSDGRRVTFRFMDAMAVNKLDRDLEEVRKKTGQEQGVTMRLLAQVVSLAGVAERKDMARALANLSARDARALRLYMDEIAPGVEMVQEYECSSCGKTSEVDLPLGTEFFWPSKG